MFWPSTGIIFGRMKEEKCSFARYDDLMETVCLQLSFIDIELQHSIHQSSESGCFMWIHEGPRVCPAQERRSASWKIHVQFKLTASSFMQMMQRPLDLKE